jgi:hypothetical protein
MVVSSRALLSAIGTILTCHLRPPTPAFDPKRTVIQTYDVGDSCPSRFWNAPVLNHPARGDLLIAASQQAPYGNLNSSTWGSRR